MEALRAFGSTTFSSLSIRNYRLYFIGQAISLSGTWMQTVALGWYALSRTGSGAVLGFIIAAQFVPVLLFGFWGGVITDRYDKKRLLLATQSAFLVLALGAATLIWLDLMQAWMLYVFALSLGVVRIFDNPTRQTFVGEMVPADVLKNAVSLNATENNLARAVGPTIGGAVIAATGVAACFFANGISYIAVIVMLLAMKDDEFYERPALRPRKGQLLAGLHYVRRVKLIRNILVMMAVVGTFAYEFQVSLPIFASETFGAGAAGYALLLSMFGAGAVAGGLYAASRKHTNEQQFITFMLLFGLAVLATAAAPSLALASLGMAVVGALSINVTALGNTIIQLEAEPAMRGRVMSLWTVAMIGSTPVGGPIVGAIGEYAGGRMSLVVGGASALVTALVALLVLKRRGRMRDISATIHMQGQLERIGSTKP